MAVAEASLGVAEARLRKLNLKQASAHQLLHPPSHTLRALAAPSRSQLYHVGHDARGGSGAALGVVAVVAQQLQ